MGCAVEVNAGFVFDAAGRGASPRACTSCGKGERGTSGAHFPGRVFEGIAISPLRPGGQIGGDCTAFVSVSREGAIRKLQKCTKS